MSFCSVVTPGSLWPQGLCLYLLCWLPGHLQGSAETPPQRSPPPPQVKSSTPWSSSLSPADSSDSHQTWEDSITCAVSHCLQHKLPGACATPVWAPPAPVSAGGIGSEDKTRRQSPLRSKPESAMSTTVVINRRSRASRTISCPLGSHVSLTCDTHGSGGCGHMPGLAMQGGGQSCHEPLSRPASRLRNHRGPSVQCAEEGADKILLHDFITINIQ